MNQQYNQFMCNRKFRCLTLLIVGLLVVFAPLSSTNAQKGLPIVAPQASFSIEGTPYTLSQFKNRRVMLWFLSTWCTSCSVALEALENKQPELIESGLQIVALKNHENGGYPGPTMHEFVNHFSPDLFDAPNWLIGDASAELGTTYNPRRYPDIYFLIDEKGMLVAVEGAPGATLDVIMDFARGATVGG
jgi:thiol-disulfide isomerase/thioredoxin